MAAMLISAQAVDYDGAVLSGAKLNVYDAGTTTPRAIYVSNALSGGASSANPAVATSAGGIAVWVDDSAGDIKVTLTNSAGTTTYYQQDDIDPTNGNLIVYPLGGSDQSLNTTDSPTFASITLGAVPFSGVVTDPGADRLMFWDDSDTQVEWLSLGTGLAITGNTLSLDGDLEDISGLTPSDGAVIIGNGSEFVTESGSTLRASLGVSVGSDVLAYDANLQAFVDAFTAPTADGTSGQYLKTDGAGVLTFDTPSGAGDTLKAADENITGIWAGGDAKTIAELKSRSVSGVVDGDKVTVSEDGKNGVFFWDSSDRSTDVTNDPLSGIIVAPSSDSSGASGAWRRKRNESIFNVFWFGATGDGSTNDSTAAQAANDAAEAAGGGTVFYPPGVYRLNTQVVCNSSNVRHVGSGVNVTILESNADNQACLIFEGTRVTGESNTLASNADSGDATVTLASGKGANFSAGNWALLLDEATITDTAQKQGEIVRVRSVATDTVTLESPIRYDYTTGNTAQLQRLEMLKGSAFEKMSLRKVTSTSSTADLSAFLYCEAPRTRDVELYQNAQGGLSMFGCVSCDIEVYAHDLESDTASKFGYGVEMAGANLGGKVYVNAERVRHAYTTINSGGVLPYGVTTGARVSGTAVDTFMASWDTHEEAQGVIFDGCTASGSGQSGFQIRGKGCQVLGGTAERCIGAGVFVPNSAADTIIDSVHTDLTNLGTDVDAVDWTDLGAIEDRGDRTTIITPLIKNAGGPGIKTHSDARDPYIVNPHIIDPCRVTTTTKTGISNLASTTGTWTVHGGLIRCSDTRMDYGIRCTNSGVDAHVSGGVRVFGAQTLPINLSNSHYAWGNEQVSPLSLGPQALYTISSGVIDISEGRSGNIAVDPESTGNPDDLVTITGGRDGDWISLRRNEAVTITIKNGTGNILTSTGADVNIDSALDNFLLKKVGSNWIMLRTS